MITFKTILDVLGFNIRTSMIAITDTFKYIYASNFEATFIAETCMWYAMTNRLWPLSLSKRSIRVTFQPLNKRVDVSLYSRECRV